MPKLNSHFIEIRQREPDWIVPLFLGELEGFEKGPTFCSQDCKLKYPLAGLK